MLRLGLGVVVCGVHEGVGGGGGVCMRGKGRGAAPHQLNVKQVNLAVKPVNVAVLCTHVDRGQMREAGVGVGVCWCACDGRRAGAGAPAW